MAQVIDYLQDENGDLIIEDGDLKQGAATSYHQRGLLLFNKGGNRQSPTAGVDAREFILDNIEGDEILHRVTEEFEGDGMTVNEVIVNGTGINIDAQYE